MGSFSNPLFWFLCVFTRNPTLLGGTRVDLCSLQLKVSQRALPLPAAVLASRHHSRLSGEELPTHPKLILLGDSLAFFTAQSRRAYEGERRKGREVEKGSTRLEGDREMDGATGPSGIHKLGSPGVKFSLAGRHVSLGWAGAMIFKNWSVNALGQECTFSCTVVPTTPYCHTSNSFLHLVTLSSWLLSPKLSSSPVLYVKYSVTKG